MKDQYVADIGDYGKYGLLRFLANKGVKVGINWYLTPGDGKTDGKYTEYLADERMREYDRDLFDAMKELVDQKHRTISEIEDNWVLDGMLFYNRELDLERYHYKKRIMKRRFWHAVAMHTLEGCELIFADPDNGLSMKLKGTEKNAQKFILANEIKGYYNAGKDVVYYHHRSRKSGDDWMNEKRAILQEIPEAKLLAVSAHRWSNRAYVFVLHDESFDRYSELIKRFLDSPWGTLKIDEKIFFTIEDTGFELSNRVESDALKIHGFAEKWYAIFEAWDGRSTLFDDLKFADEARACGFDMDCGNTFAGAFPGYTYGLDSIRRILRENKDIDPMMIGTEIFSQWRYFNHWAMSGATEEDRQWFLEMLGYLKEKTDKPLDESSRS